MSSMTHNQSMQDSEKNSSAYINEVLEEERARIAREMHDELGQQLTALKMDMDNIQRECKSEDSLRSKVNEAMIFIDQIIDTVRRISLELRPSILDDLGLLAALEWQCDNFQKKTKINCTFHQNVSSDNFEKGLTNAVFRILQEALTNVNRHASATNVEVLVTEQNSLLAVEVNDNGKGCAALDLKKNTLGVLGMKERARMMHGELTIYGDRHGTKLKVSLPLNS